MGPAQLGGGGGGSPSSLGFLINILIDFSGSLEAAGSSCKCEGNEDMNKAGLFLYFKKHFPPADLHFLSFESCIVLVFCPDPRGGKFFDVFTENFS